MALALRVGATPPGVNLAAGCRPRGFVAPCASAAPPRQRNVRSFVACGAAAGVAAALLLAAAPLAAVATDPLVSLNAPELFLRTCAGCHAGGGNVVDMSRSLRAPDLERNGYKDSQTLSDVIYKGKGKMPGYGVGCAPRGQCTFGARLSDADIASLAAYVTEQAARGWPAPQ